MNEAKGGVRFAPSPTGKLHLGNLRTAWISAQLAQLYQVPWHVRFDDIDRPRVLPGAQAEQLADLARLGLRPERISVQSENHSRHFALFSAAREAGMLYLCTCSRTQVAQALAAAASAPHGAEPIYAGTCRNRVEPVDTEALGTRVFAWRFRAPDPSGAEDFIVARGAARACAASFQPSYHWATAIDDLDGDFLLLVRAWDLASALTPQRRVQAWLLSAGFSQKQAPAVYHTSLVVSPSGKRLEKRSQGVFLEEILARGLSPEALLDFFASSWQAPPKVARPEPLRELGELSRELPVGRLLPESYTEPL